MEFLRRAGSGLERMSTPGTGVKTRKTDPACGDQPIASGL
ncbi:Hypothetical protein CAP_7050 [Chondromyces apiculatus DSM 436]|uniref:Uncharacterized protein n=1 Tax=Chondromyces apiculatus DSM 436 TaxID=1192034 RepID=A0A017TFI4_9BACT|nr:Hypothetical protein CAP_7050 [Chondromyces apiculatus DSM 436]